MGLRVAREPLTAALLAELSPLIEAASAEVHGGRLALAVDYLALEAAGRYATWVARDDAGAAVGVCGMVFGATHKGEASASQDVLFLVPAARAGCAAAGFLRAVDKALVDIGVAIVYRAAPSGSGLGALYGRAGYEPVETIHARSLR